MKRNSLLNCFAALALCTLLLVCTGCEKAQAPSYTPDPNPPSTIFLNMDKGALTITNAKGQTLTHGEGFSGTMDILEQWENQESLSSDPHWEGFVLRVLYSDHVVYERPEAVDEDEFWHISMDGFRDDNSFRTFFSARGGGTYGGSVERVEYDVSGSLLVRGEPGGGMVEVTLTLPDNTMLDQSAWRNGWVKFTAMIGEQGEMRLEGRGDIVRFSGLDPQLVLLAYGPDYMADLNLEIGTGLDLEVGSGTLDLSRVAEGQIILQEDGCEARVLGKTE